MTDTEQLLSDSIDKISELSIENHRLKAQIEKMRSALIEVMCQSVNTTSEIYKKNTEQIEKMKCCGNCKCSAQETVYSIVCKVGGVNKGEIENVEDCLVCDKWEIQENE